MQPAWEQEICCFQFSRSDPGLKALSGLFRDLELHRPLSLLLHDRRPGRHVAPATDILGLQPRKIARSELAINC